MCDSHPVLLLGQWEAAAPFPFPQKEVGHSPLTKLTPEKTSQPSQPSPLHLYTLKVEEEVRVTQPISHPYPGLGDGWAERQAEP